MNKPTRFIYLALSFFLLTHSLQLFADNFDSATNGLSAPATPASPMVMDITVCDGESTEITPVAGMGAGTGGGTSIIFSETFDTDGEGVAGACTGAATSTCATNVAPANGQWSITGDVSGFTATSDFAITSGGMLEFQDTDTEVCFTTSMIDISACTTSDFMVGISEAGTMESTDYVDVNFIVDGVSSMVPNWMGLGDGMHTLIDDFTATTVSQTGIVGNTLVIEICVMNNSGAESHFLDNIMVGCDAAGTGAVTFKYYDMDPATGATPIAGPTTDPFDPMTAAGEMDMIWVTACEGTCESAASKVTVIVNEIPMAPMAMGGTFCDGDMIADVVPTGEAGALFSYYSDAGLMTLIQTGATYTPMGTIGVETIYITQTINGCESDAVEVNIEVLPTPAAPTAESVTFCLGEPVEDIEAVGEPGAIFTYYSDAALTALIQTGANYTPMGNPGTETVFVTQTVGGCESAATQVDITIAGFENITVEPTCNVDVLDYCLDITFDFVGPGPSNMYEVVVNGILFGPFAYGTTGSEAITICDPVNFIGDEQTGLAVEVADLDRGNLTEGITQTGGGASNLEGCIEISAVLAAQNADNNGDGLVDFCDEFITLTNGGTAPLDISGYTISDAVAVRHIFTTVTLINPGQTITLFNSDLNQVANCAGSGIWNNGGDDIILNDAIGGLVDMETYGGSTAGVQEDFEVIGCGQGMTTGTGPSSCLQINSVMANQNADNDGDGAIDFCDEFITITNPGNMPLDISGYMISDAATLRHIFPTTTILAPGQVLTIFNSDLSEVANCAGAGVWNNGGDDIIIVDALGAPVDSETYGGSQSGVEFAFAIDPCPVGMIMDNGVCSGLTEFDEPNCCPEIEISSFMAMSICAGSCPAPGSGLMVTGECGNIPSASETKWYSDPAGMFLVFEGDVFDPISEGVLDNSTPGQFKFYAQVSCDFCLSELTPVTVDIFDCDPPNDACGGCTYIVQLYDTGFNGWEGASFTVSVNEGPDVEYKVTASDCGFLSFPIDIIDGGTIDFAYWEGSNSQEDAYKILDGLGNVVASEGIAFTGNNIVGSVDNRVDVICPMCCTDATEPFEFVFTAGTDAFEKSWEIRDNNGVRVAFANAGTYSGLFNGQSDSQTLFLDPCEEYTITTFAARNNGWEGGTYTLLSSNADRGVQVAPNTYQVAAGPMTFTEELSSTFTLPCSMECPDEETILADDLDNCLLNAHTAMEIEAPICYPNNCHFSPEPSLTVCYPSAIGGLVEGPLGTTSASLPVGSNTLIYKATYSDGQIIKCTTQVHVISEVNPQLACNDFVILPLIDDNDDCETVITADMILEDPDPCNAQYLIELTDPNGNDLGNVISNVNAGQVLDYSITQIGTGLSALCEGQILVEDKAAPNISCVDYVINCNHPNALDETYTHTETFEVDAAELPGNIAGGTVSNPSELILPILDVGCGPFGEIIQDINVTVDIEHDDIEDLTIILVAPDGTTVTLLERRTCNNQFSRNIDVTFDSEASSPVFSGCNPGIPGLSGTFQPAQPLNILYNRFYSDLEGDWQLIVRDDDEQNVAIGLGEVLSASIELTAGFPFPYAASDCNLTSVNLINEIFVDTNCDQSGGLGTNIVRVWQATDAAGNVSECTQNVGLRAPNISDVTIPDDIVLACGDVPTSPDELSLDDSGIPFFECFEIEESDLNNCDIILTYEDEFFESCGDGYKLFRTWNILNWCAGTSMDVVQTIFVLDEIGPEIAQSNIIISADETCSADVDLVDLQITDACSAIENVTATYLVGASLQIVDLGAGEIIEGLLLGNTTVTISATDECGNTSEEEVIIAVVDNVVPTASCNDGLNITLSNDGIGELTAANFDEGSNDNCSDVSLLIRSLGCEGGTFSQTAEFSCCDIGTVIVELLVTDAAGNTNICWSEVLIEDATAPVISCEADLTITCEDEANAESLFQAPVATDNCNVDIEASEIVTVDLPNCGQLLTRTWTASDASDKSDDATCSQTITVLHVSDFIVQFPADVDFDNCMLGDIPGPIITEDDCEMVSISTEDRIFTQVPGACYQIERTYTVVNNCIVDDPSAGEFTDLGIPLPIPNTFRDDDGYFQFTQIITVNDGTAPSISFIAPFPCDFTDGCEGEAILTATTEDDCADLADVSLSFEIDAFGDGTVDITGSGDDATGTYPYGDHLITWIATDGCGNVTVEEYSFSLEDCKNPTPVGQGVTTVVMNNGECVSIWANDLLEYAEDNCTERTIEEWDDNAMVRREGSNGPLSTSIELCCEDIVDGAVNVEVWVEDEAGNADFIIVAVVVQDNGSNCPTMGTQSAQLIGSTFTDNGKAVKEVIVEINGAEMGITNQQGVFQLALGLDEMYRVEPTKDGDDPVSISTFDLVILAQHVLQVNLIDNPYRLLAGDVTQNGVIDIFDMIEIRQLILFQLEEFSNVDSWIFVPADYEFQNPNSPFSEDVPTFMDIDFTEDYNSADFIGIKMGDMDGSFENAQSTSVDERGVPKKLIFEATDKLLEKGEQIELELLAKDFDQILGFQYTLDFDPSALAIVNEKPGSLDVSKANFGNSFLDQGKQMFSYHNNKPVTFEDGEVLYSITLSALEDVMLSEVLQLSSSFTKAEAYNSKEEKLDLSLVFTDRFDQQLGTFKLYQNKPNPFRDDTIIEFDLPNSDYATMTVFDVSGRVVYRVSDYFESGVNQIVINKSQIGQIGLLYYSLQSGAFTAQKKMILIE